MSYVMDSYTMNHIAQSEPSGIAVAISIVLGIIILILFFVAIFLAMRTIGLSDQEIEATEIASPPGLNVNSIIGASTDGFFDFDNGDFYQDPVACESGPTRSWSSDRDCLCINPFYGNKCFRETYDTDYIAIGNPSDDDIRINTISNQDVDRLSFPYQGEQIGGESQVDVLCTGLCDSNNSCVGVLWNPAPNPNEGIDDPTGPKSQCTLLSSNVILNPGKNIPYSNDTDTTLYLKKWTRLNVKDRVFAYTGEPPLRYWLQDRFLDITDKVNAMIAMYERTPYNFDFTPFAVINDTGCPDNLSDCNFGDPWVGIFANSEDLLPITDSDITNVINTGSNNNIVVIPSGTRQLNLPTQWREIWGIYIDPSTVN